MSITQENPAGSAEPTTAPSGSDDGSGRHTAPPEESSKRRRKILLILLAFLLAVILLVIGSFIWYLITHKPITALPGMTSDATPHFNYSIYGVTAPIGVAVTADGSRIYVTESDGTRLTKEFDHSGKLINTLTPPASTGKGHIPLYVTLDPVNGDVYVSDRLAASIYVYNSAGKFLRTFKPSPTVPGWAPLGIAFDSARHLYVTQAVKSTSQISVFDVTGHLVRVLKTQTAMSFPNGIAVSPAGIVAVADSNNGRVILMSSTGTTLSTISAGMAPADLGLPRGITFDSQGHLVVVDATNQGIRVYKWANNAVSFVGAAGDEGIGNGLFEYPNGTAADSRAYVYITDRMNNRLQVWSY